MKARKRDAERMNAKLAEWISESVKYINEGKKEKAVYCWETTELPALTVVAIKAAANPSVL